MLIGSLFALALAAAEPTPPASGSAPAPQHEPELPAGAPEDDYGLVAWCHGALSGHMELRALIKEELDELSPGPPDDDARQQAAGKQYLALYERALKAAEKASPTSLEGRSRAASNTGYAIWAPARTADPRNRMWAYLMWDLPGRCEFSAKRLEERSTLFGEALRPSSNAGADLGPLATAPASDGGLRGAR